MATEFLELLESVRVEAQDVGGTMSRMMRGGVVFRQKNKELGEAYSARLMETIEIIADYHERGGAFNAARLEEAMSVDDFPYLFGDIIDRTLLAGYREAPKSWDAYCEMVLRRDFRTANSYAVDGAEGVLTGVDEHAPYPAASLSETRYQMAVAKYGRKIPLSWEMIINDDMGAFQSIPARLGRAARRTEERAVAALMCDTSGPHASFYSSGNANIVNTTNGASADNPALSTSGINDGLKVLASMTDADGEPIDLISGEITLVTGLTLATTAKQILNTMQFEVTDPTGQVRVVKGTGLGGNISHVVNPYINSIATTNGDTTWFLFVSPKDSRPALQVGFLRGRQEPEVYMKEPNARRVGGGVNPLEGDFDNDSIEYKVRHCLGAGRVDPKGTVGSNGSGA